MEEGHEKTLKSFSTKRVTTLKRIEVLKSNLKTLSRYPKRLRIHKDLWRSVNEEFEMLLQSLDQAEDFVHHIGRIVLGEKHGKKKG